MKTVLRLLACCGAVAALLLAIAYPTQNEHGWPGRSHRLTVFLKEQHRSDDLDERMADFLRRKPLKDEITKEVIAQRVTLLEAAARFHELEGEALDPTWVECRRNYPGGSDAERRCRQVITRVKVLLWDRPEEAVKTIFRFPGTPTGREHSTRPRPL